jgi:TusA-related sulfurtransferase
MPAVLDPRDARPLTSREIAKLLVGVIAGVVAHDPEAHDEIPKAIKSGARDAILELKRANWIVAFRATVASLRGWCDEREVNTALAWLGEHAGKIFPPGGGAPVSSMN